MMPTQLLPEYRLRRRHFVRGAVGAALAAILAACGGDKATNTPAQAPSSPVPPPTIPPTTVTVASTAAAATAARPSVAGSPAGGTAASGTSPAASGTASRTNGEQEVTFTSGKDTIYGTLLVPGTSQSQKLPAALILAGSGPTDRDGNTKVIPGPVDTLRNFANVFASQGIASLRYDKLASGKTGLASITNVADITFSVFVDEARAAYAFLRARPEIDSRRMLVLGHSEGGLIALVMTNQLKGSSEQPTALVLAAPLGTPYLETLQRQLTDQYMQALRAGQVTQAQVDAGLMELNRTIASLKESGKVPADLTNPAVKQIFNTGNEAFLAEAEKYDPRQVAAALPPTLPTLVLHGLKDQQVSTADVQNVMQGFQMAGNTKAMLAELPDVDHVFKEVLGTPNPATDYINPALHFSSEATTHLTAFVRASL